MKIALIADIHGNAVALDAVLSDISKERVDQIICLGDIVNGPQPLKVLKRVRELRCPIVMGNADGWLLGQFTPEPEGEIGKRILDMGNWCRDQLSATDLDFLKSFEPTIRAQLNDETELLCFHGSPRSYDEIIRATTPDEELEPIFVGLDAQIYAGGHTHTPMLRRYKSSFLINPGSVGLPYFIDAKSGSPRNLAEGEYALLRADGRDLSVDFRRVPFDAEEFARAVLQTGMPHAEWFAAEWRK
ncbi:metallophosphoesterase family protein [Candidatus Acetothermia bacterium]|nr:metallophosphoesterase family protein [Candidatus Acetothermia bacterium]MBI3643712.1 metallophosphoesterase family protein [Candidatus Acetothermia bacterium]